MSLAVTADLTHQRPHPLVLRLALAAVFAGLADWLFFGWRVGISLALFLGILGAMAVACNRVHATHHTRIIMTAVFIAGLAAVVEDISFLSVLMATLATGLFVIVLTARNASSWQRYLFEAATVPLRGPFQLVRDIIRALQRTKQLRSKWLGWLVGWIVPLGILAIFVSLFASANPLIENQLKWIDLRRLLDFIESWRTALWIAIICVIWPLLHRRVKPRATWKYDSDRAPDKQSKADHLLGETAITRSLILFNALFALQTGLDLICLWGGVSLPDGMSYAEYAHRGAYPLMVTALLAAGFVLIAMRPGGPAESSRLIRPLVLAWIAQNILLVMSSIFRLDLYVAAYSLTYLRLAAFIWMGLVAAGLVLVLIQIVRKKSNGWLLSANALTLVLTLYGCCFLNAPRLIATYNVEHSREVTGTGPSVDMDYLVSLGSPEILPVVEPRMARFPGIVPPRLAYRISAYRDHFREIENWRAFSFRTWRLQRYFANTSPGRLNPSDSGKG